MCGITGIVGPEIERHSEDLSRMLKAMAHRGPNAEGRWEGSHIELGHRRLSILDPSTKADQPMVHSSQRYVITYNGEIYNFYDIRKILINKGHVFQTESDTEVILNAWAEWGVKALDFCEGMFVFALWDIQDQTLYIARDRFGEKPLFYFFQNKTLVFASELKALRNHRLCPQTLNREAIHQFLSFNYILSDLCIFSDVHKLPAAHVLIYKLNQPPTIVCYWQLSELFHKPKHRGSESAILEEWAHLFSGTIDKTCHFGGDLGSFLSGGIDSSAILAAMMRTQSSSKIQAFTIGFTEKRFDEIEKAKIVSQYFRIKHHTQIMGPNSLDDLAHIVRCADEPFADTSMIPTYYLAQLARQSVSVCLSGDGGDELFAGYETYKSDQFQKWGKHLPFKKFLANLIQSIPDQFQKVGWDYKVKKFSQGLTYSTQRAHVFWRTIFSASELKALIHPQHQDLLVIDPFQSFICHYADVVNCPLLEQHLYVDMKTWLADDILVKVDRMSMANSLEVRIPFLNHKLAEWIIRLPTSSKMRYHKTKYFLKKSQQSHLPHQIIHGKKEGFSAPVGDWFTSETRDLTLSGPLTQWVSEHALQKFWSEHLSRKRDHSYKLFNLICLSLWLGAVK